MTYIGIILLFIVVTTSCFNAIFAENCQLSNLAEYVYQDFVPINASNYWIYALQNDCSLQIWSNGSATEEYSNNSNNRIYGIFEKNSTKCKNGQISTYSNKNTVSIQVFVQNNETSEIFIKTLTPSELETTKITEVNSTFVLENSNNQSMQPLSCYSMPKSEHSLQPFIICIFYNSNESRLFSGIYDFEDGNFSNLNPIHGIQNQTLTLPNFFSSKVSVSFYRDDFNQKLTAYLYNLNGDFMVLENLALSASFTLTVKKLTKMQKTYQNFIHISSFEPFSIFFEAFTSEFCSLNVCRKYLFPFLTDPSPICFDERKEKHENDYFGNVGIIFNNFQLKSDTLNPYANPSLIFQKHGAVILTGILLITTIFLTILLTFCVIGIAKCLKSVPSEDENGIEVSKSVHEEENVLESAAQNGSQNLQPEECASRTIVVVESLSQPFEDENGYEDEENGEPTFKPKNFSFYAKD